MKKKILIIGGGAREYALGRKFREDARIGDIYFSPGNGGTQSIGENVALENHEEVVRFATDKHIDLVVIGPQEPLIEGLSDALALAEIKVFGPSQKVSILEASKSFTKNLALNLNIPTSPFFIAQDYDTAREQVQSCDFPLVIGPDDLIQNIVIAKNAQEAQLALERFFVQEKHSRVVVEQFLEGFELSILALAHHQGFLLLPPCQNYKQLSDNGPRTGGMGAFAPTHFCDEAFKQKIASTIVTPILDEMVRQGTPFVGVLFVEIMVVPTEGQLEPYLLKCHVRFGDPECSVLLPLLKTPLLDLCEATIAGTLQDLHLELHHQHSLGVVLASKDYPYKISQGQSVYIDPFDEKTGHLDLGKIAQENGLFVVSGGRVCVCVGKGKSLTEAKNHAYGLVKKVQFEGMQFREDIGAL